MKKLLFIILCVFCIFTFTGCQHITDTAFSKLGLQSVASANARIGQVQEEANSKISQIETQIKIEEKVKLDSQLEQMQKATDQLFGATYAFSLLSNPSRYDLVTYYHINAAADYLHLSPSPEAIKQQIELIKKELDEKNTTLGDLQKQYDVLKNDAELIAKQKQLAEDTIKNLQEKTEQIKKDTNDNITKIQNEKDMAVQDAFAKQQSHDNQQKLASVERLKKEIMCVTGALALMTTLAAIFLPLFKQDTIIAAAIFSGITIAIPFIQAWMINTVFGILIVIAIGYASSIYLKHHKLNQQLITESTTSNNLVNAIQDIKEKSKETYDQHLAPVLKEWNTKYITGSDGLITKVEDTDVVKTIEQKLVNSLRK